MWVTQEKSSSGTANEWRAGDMKLIEHTNAANLLSLQCLRMEASQLQS